MSKRKIGQISRDRSVHFNGVSVFKFARMQGFTSVPSAGGSTLGMLSEHEEIRTMTLEEHEGCSMETRQARAEEGVEDTEASTSDAEECLDEFEFDAEDEEDGLFFIQPMGVRQRRQLLRSCGVAIDRTEMQECRTIRESREQCGCACADGVCVPGLCSCDREGINCQVDRLSFPCACRRESCSNSNGRVEFDPLRVRRHYVQTMRRLTVEANAARCSQEAKSIRLDNPAHQSGAKPQPYSDKAESLGSDSSSSDSGYDELVRSGDVIKCSNDDIIPLHKLYPHTALDDETPNMITTLTQL